MTALLVLAPAPALAGTRDTTPPTVPPNFRITSVTSSQVFVAYDASTDNTGVTHYELKLNGPSGERTYFPSGHGPGFGGLPSDTLHSVTVRAFDVAGNASAWATPLSFTTLVAPPKQNAPKNLRGEFRNGKLYALVWDAVPTSHPVQSYTVFADSGSGPEFVWSTTTTSVTVADLIYSVCLNPQTYTFTVTAGNSDPSAPITLALPWPADA